MNITRQRIQNLIKEAIANDSTASPTGLITIEQYLESVDYDVDPSLVDLFFTLIVG